MTLRGRTEVWEFWRSLSLEQLSERQGVSVADDLDAISALWLADDDPDDLFQHVCAAGKDRGVGAMPRKELKNKPLVEAMLDWRS